MRRSLLAAAGVLGVVVLSGCGLTPSSSQTALPGSSTPVASRSAGSMPEPGGTINQIRPRKDLTPGALNLNVTQANINSTICKSGWTATIRPPVSYTEPLKRQQIAQYGYADKKLGDYEEDHLVPLELGGAPKDQHNLWPEPGATPNPKDAEERSLNRQVCSGKRTLASAQQQILMDWGPL